MGLWLRFDKSHLNSVTFEEFLNYINKHSLLSSDKNCMLTLNSCPQQLAPAQHFFQTLK